MTNAERAKMYMAYNAFVIYRNMEYSFIDAMLLCKNRFELNTEQLNELGYRTNHLELVKTVAKTEMEHINEIITNE